MGKIKVILVKSVIGQSEATRRIIRALGLGRISSTHVLKDNNCVRGMVNKVKHLIKFELVNS